MYKPKIGITIGDINGIGPEIIIKAFSKQEMLNLCTPVIYASEKVMVYYKKAINAETFQFTSVEKAESAVEGKVNVINCWKDEAEIKIGEITEVAGRMAHISLDYCLHDIKHGFIDSIVTAPIHKKSMQLASFPYPGHTEYLQQETEGKSLMMLCYDDLRVALVTTHIPISEVSKSIDKDRIIGTIERVNETLIVDFDIERPLIAVLGLNPHAGDEGLMGDEEDKYIKPAIEEAKSRGILAYGPFAADGFFGSGAQKKYHAVVAMYHDQGLVAFKSLAFGRGVNYTAGLNIVRTSPDHGTGFDISGKNLADESSFRMAIYSAVDIWRNRNDYHEFRKNKLKPSRKNTERRKNR